MSYSHHPVIHASWGGAAVVSCSASWVENIADMLRTCGDMSIIDSNGVDEFSLRSIGVAAIGAVLLLLVLQAIAGRGPRNAG